MQPVARSPELLPELFCPVLAGLVAAGDVSHLSSAFVWRTTHEGSDHWSAVAAGRVCLSTSDVATLLAWIARYYAAEETPT